jgi:hypothetical protein
MPMAMVEPCHARLKLLLDVLNDSSMCAVKQTAYVFWFSALDELNGFMTSLFDFLHYPIGSLFSFHYLKAVNTFQMSL